MILKIFFITLGYCLIEFTYFVLLTRELWKYRFYEIVLAMAFLISNSDSRCNRCNRINNNNNNNNNSSSSRGISSSERNRLLLNVCLFVPSSDKLILPSSNRKILSICAISCFSSSSSLSISNNNSSKISMMIIKFISYYLLSSSILVPLLSTL